MDSTNLIASVFIQLLTIVVYILRKKFRVSSDCVNGAAATVTPEEESRNRSVDSRAPSRGREDVPGRLNFTGDHFATTHGSI